jgi:S1-C subfamily serine protease
VDKPVRVSLYREGKVIQTELQLRRRNMAVAGVTRDNRRFRWQGMLLGPIPAGWTPPADQKERPSAGLMVIGISDTSPFTKEHIRMGDIITAVAGKPIADVLELQRVINDQPSQKCQQLSVSGRDKTVAIISE